MIHLNQGCRSQGVDHLTLFKQSGQIEPTKLLLAPSSHRFLDIQTALLTTNVILQERNQHFFNDLYLFDHCVLYVVCRQVIHSHKCHHLILLQTIFYLSNAVCRINVFTLLFSLKKFSLILTYLAITVSNNIYMIINSYLYIIQTVCLFQLDVYSADQCIPQTLLCTKNVRNMQHFVTKL